MNMLLVAISSTTRSSTAPRTLCMSTKQHRQEGAPAGKEQGTASGCWQVSELLQDNSRWVCAWSMHSLGKEHLLCSCLHAKQTCGQDLVLE